jgi:hypothetical protein
MAYDGSTGVRRMPGAPNAFSRREWVSGVTVRIDQRDGYWAVRRRRVGSVDPSADLLPVTTGPRFPRFAAAMDVARAANAPHLRLADDPSLYDIPPAMSHDAPRPRAAQWRATRPTRRPVGRWLGIAGCLALVGGLTAAALTQPIGAEIGRLIRPWLEWPQARELATPRTGQIPSTAPERSAGRDQTGSRPLPVVTRQDLEVTGPSATTAPAAGAAAHAPGDPSTLPLPLPSLKPPAGAQ